MEISLDLQQGTDVEKKRDETIPIKETEINRTDFYTRLFYAFYSSVTRYSQICRPFFAKNWQQRRRESN